MNHDSLITTTIACLGPESPHKEAVPVDVNRSASGSTTICQNNAGLRRYNHAEDKDMVKISVKIPKELVVAVKRIRWKDGITIQSTVIQALAAYLKNP